MSNDCGKLAESALSMAGSCSATLRMQASTVAAALKVAVMMVKVMFFMGLKISDVWTVGKSVPGGG